jgi:hypothetical protein
MHRSATLVRMIKARYGLLRGTTRLSALMTLMVCLSTQPVLAALGAIHDFSSHPDSALLSHGEHSAAHNHTSTSDNDHKNERDPLHGLLHFGHCCGHASGIIGSNWALKLPVRTALPPAWPVSLRTPSVDLTNPFRPPIPV